MALRAAATTPRQRAIAAAATKKRVPIFLDVAIAKTPLVSRTTFHIATCAAGSISAAQEEPEAAQPTAEHGEGTHENPFHRPLRKHPNRSGCYHCPEEACVCARFEALLAETFDALKLKRVTEVAGQKNMCAKSILPVFVSRLVRIANVRSSDTFYDLGCGNGSVLFQVAFMTGARCVGVELSKHNAELARQAWAALKPRLEALAKRPMPEVEIIDGDLADVIASESFGSANTVIFTSNLLFPKALTHYMSERFRSLPRGARILCFDDLYPHGRSIARIRDPEAFELFAMVDYVWQECSVEWCTAEGRFYLHLRK